MTLVLAAALVLLLLLGVAGVVLAVLVFSREDGPSEAPAWLGPSPQQLEAAIRASLDGRRERPLSPHPSVVELARHHAFDMAIRGFGGERDPEGADLAGRRLRLHPSFVGALEQWSCVLGSGDPTDPAGLAAALIEGCGDLGTLEGGELDVLGVGVAAERGRLACCIVAGSWWATLEDTVRGDLPATGWVVEGVVEGDVEVEELALRTVSGGEPRPAIPLEPEGRFQLRSDEAPGSGIEVQVVRGGAEGLPRPI